MKTSRIQPHALFFITTVLTAVTSGSASASSFMLREGSPDWMGNAFAGDAAKGYDSSTVWSNPAGMVRLNGNEISGALNGIFPNTTFSGVNSFGAAGLASGTQGGNVSQAGMTSAAFGVWNYSPDLKFGIGQTMPFGQRTVNPTAFVGRYQSLVSSITDVAFTVAAAYRVNDKLSIGGGPVIDYFAARLTQAVNIGSAAALTGDPTADVHGDNVGVGYNLGLMYQATPDFRVGLDYHSAIPHTIHGSQALTVPALLQTLSPTTAAQLAALNTSVNAKLTLPDSVVAGAYWQLNPQWAVMTDLQLTRWSVLRTLSIVPSNPLLPSSTLQENWHDTFSVSVGVNYQFNDKLMLQGGAGYDQSPVTYGNRTTRLPDSDHTLLGFGVQYAVMPGLTVQAAYAHIFFAPAAIANAASTTSGVIVGNYTSNADTVAAGFKYRF